MYFVPILLHFFNAFQCYYLNKEKHWNNEKSKVFFQWNIEFEGESCQSFFFNKAACLRPVTLLKKWLWHMCFPVNFTKFLRTPFLRNTSGRLLLEKELLNIFNENIIHCLLIFAHFSNLQFLKFFIDIIRGIIRGGIDWCDRPPFFLKVPFEKLNEN